MTVRKNLGDILLEVGRITQQDVERGLEYQREHGGFFGQALVALEIVRAAEVEWALATQFDLPLIFPDAAAVDPQVARVVSSDWALAHLAVPIMRSKETLTVVVENPLDREVIADLRERTGLDVDVALAPPQRIRELVRALYAAPLEDSQERRRSPSTLGRFIEEALDAGMDRLGISVRGGTAIGWFAVGAPPPSGGRTAEEPARIRRPLAPGWENELAAAIAPDPAERAPSLEHRVSRWSATLRHGDSRLPIDVRMLVGDRGVEYVFHLLEKLPSAHVAARGRTIPPAIAAELRLLGRDGVRVAITAAKADLAASMLPRIPGLVWDDCHAVHLGTEKTLQSAMTLVPESPSDPMLEALTAYSFDVLTVDLPADEYALERLFAASDIVFARLREPDWEQRLGELGVGWIMTVDDPWELRPVRERKS